MRHLKTVLTVLGAVTVLVLASNTVVTAATGQGFILGKGNSANNITALKRTTSGSVLKLESATSANPPMTVTGTGKVGNLNADKVDGYDSTALLNRTYVWTKSVSDVTNLSLVVPIPAGTWEIGYSVYMSGGGGAGASGCYLRRSNPDYTYYGEDRSATDAGSPGHSGSGIITIDADDEIRLVCSAPGTWSTLANEPIQVYASPTSVFAGSGALRQAAPSARVGE